MLNLKLFQCLPKNNGEENPDEFYKNKYQNHDECSFIYRLVCVDDKCCSQV